MKFKTSKIFFIFFFIIFGCSTNYLHCVKIMSSYPLGHACTKFTRSGCAKANNVRVRVETGRPTPILWAARRCAAHIRWHGGINTRESGQQPRPLSSTPPFPWLPHEAFPFEYPTPWLFYLLAAMQDSAAGDPCPWSQDLDPLLRPQVLDKMYMCSAPFHSLP